MRAILLFGSGGVPNAPGRWGQAIQGCGAREQGLKACFTLLSATLRRLVPLPVEPDAPGVFLLLSLSEPLDSEDRPDVP